MGRRQRQQTAGRDQQGGNSQDDFLEYFVLHGQCFCLVALVLSLL
jgi:hypothetical protein